MDIVVAELRERLRKMDDTLLLRCVQTAKYMCSAEANPPVPPPHDCFVQLCRIAREI